MRTKILNSKSLVITVFCILTHGCTADLAEESPDGLEIRLDCGEFSTRSSITSEDGIWDVNLFVFSEDGMEEFHSYTAFGKAKENEVELYAKLVKSREYTVAAFANAGFDIGDFPDWKALEKWKYYLAYPDGGNRGIPMCGICENFLHDGKSEAEIRMERLMSRISIRLDKSQLDKDIDFHVMRATVGNCPKCITAFTSGTSDGDADFFAYGYSSEWFSDKWQSVPVNLYMLENMQGHFDSSKCSYVELEIDYNSPECHSSSEKGLIYRFYIRENDSFNVSRNSIYNVTVCPRHNGLMCEDDWRVDKSSLVYYKNEPKLEIIPAGSTIDGRFYEHFYRMAKGGSRHFELSKGPENMEVHFREDLLQDEKNDGRAEYIMDPDGKGFTVKSLGKVCSSAMEIQAGEPLNDYIMLVIEME